MHTGSILDLILLNADTYYSINNKWCWGLAKAEAHNNNNNERCAVPSYYGAIWSVCRHKADPERGETILKENNGLS
jgi:hypothetical protein